MSLLEVKHQLRAHRAIQRAITAGRMPHAYLFHGPDGVGKEMFARGLAQLLLCPQAQSNFRIANEPQEQTGGLFAVETELRPAGSEPRPSGGGSPSNPTNFGLAPCGRCEDCRMTLAETHPDWHLIYRQLNRDHPDPDVRKRKGLDIGVDVLRHFVIDKVGFTPIRGRAKVFVIREADRMTPQAQNALLKTLEEPPGTTYLMLLVTSIDRLLPTTLSRCQVIEFDPLPKEFVRERLRALCPNLAPAQAEWCAHFAGGSIGSAMQAVEEHLFDVHARVRNSLFTAVERPAARGGERSGSSRGAQALHGGGPWAAPSTLLTAFRSQCLKVWTDEAEALGELYRKRDPDITDTEATRRGWKMVFRLLADSYAEQFRVGPDLTVPRPADRRDTGFQPVRSVDQNAHSTGSLIPEAAADAIGRIAQAERHLDLNANTQLVVETLANDLARIQSGEPAAVF